MDFIRYAERSAALVNAELPDEEALREHLADRSWLHRSVVEGDVESLRAFRSELRAVFEASDVDDVTLVVSSLNSLLERHNMTVISASNGREAIELVEREADLALVLMDIMMPEMDGYETIRRIREKPKFRLLPIIALTAKAMKGDREKCLEAGASDYVAKPVNTEQLLSLVRMWLHR